MAREYGDWEIIEQEALGDWRSAVGIPAPVPAPVRPAPAPVAPAARDRGYGDWEIVSSPAPTWVPAPVAPAPRPAPEPSGIERGLATAGNALGTVLDYVGRPGAAATGALRAFGRQQDIGQAALAGWEGRAEAQGQAIAGDLGVPDEPFLPGDADMPLWGGIRGALTPRNVAGFAIDVAADPLNLVPGAAVGRGLGRAGRAVTTTGRNMPGPVGAGFRAAEDLFIPSAARGGRISSTLADELYDAQKAIEAGAAEGVREIAPLVQRARALGTTLDEVRDRIESRGSVTPARRTAPEVEVGDTVYSADGTKLEVLDVSDPDTLRVRPIVPPRPPVRAETMPLDMGLDVAPPPAAVVPAPPATIRGDIAPPKGNRFLLHAEPKEGLIPATEDDLVAHFRDIALRYDANEARMIEVQEKLEGLSGGSRGGQRPVRPPWATGMTDEGILAVARHFDVSPYREEWWVGPGLYEGMGEMEDVLSYFRQIGTSRTGRQAETPTALKKELAALRREQKQIMAAMDELEATPPTGQWYRQAPRAADELDDLPVDFAPAGADTGGANASSAGIQADAIPTGADAAVRGERAADAPASGGAVSAPPGGTAPGAGAAGQLGLDDFAPPAETVIGRSAVRHHPDAFATTVDDAAALDGALDEALAASDPLRALERDLLELFQKRRDLELQAGVAPSAVAGPYIPRRVDKSSRAGDANALDFSRPEISTSAGGAGKHRTFETAAEGKAAGVVYVKTEEAAVQRIARSIRMVESARIIQRVLNGEIVDDAGEALVRKGAPSPPLAGAGWKAEEKAFSLIPELKGYSAHPDVVDGLERWHQAFVSDEATKGFLKAFDAVQGTWKASVTGPFLAFHLRNAVGNFWNNWMGGLENPLRYAEAANVQRGVAGTVGRYSYDEVRREVEKRLLGSGQFGADIPALIEQATHLPTSGVAGRLGYGSGSAALKDAGVSAGLSVLTGGVALPPDMGRRLGSVLEGNSKLAMVLDQLHKGKTLDNAINHARKWTIDYGDLTPFERNVMKRAVPFFTWTRKNLPLQLEAIATQPAKIHRLALALDGLDNSETMSAEERSLLPRYLKDNLGIVLGRDAKGNPLILAGLGLPIEDINRLWREKPDEMGREWLGMLGPLQRMAIELGSGQSMFTGKPIQDDRLSNFYRRVYPSIADKPALKAFLQVQEEQVRDPDTGESQTYYTADPMRAYLLGSILGRFMATGGKLADDRKDPWLRLLNYATGARVQSVDTGRVPLDLTVGDKQKLRELEARFETASQQYGRGEMTEKGWKALRRTYQEQRHSIFDNAFDRALKDEKLTPEQEAEKKAARRSLLTPAEREIQDVYDLDMDAFVAKDPENGEKAFWDERKRRLQTLSPDARKAYDAAIERRIKTLPEAVQPVEREYQQALKLRDQLEALPKYKNLPKEREDEVAAALKQRQEYREQYAAKAMAKGYTDEKYLTEARKIGDERLAREFPEAARLVKVYSQDAAKNPDRAKFERENPLLAKWFGSGAKQQVAAQTVASGGKAPTPVAAKAAPKPSAQAKVVDPMGAPKKVAGALVPDQFGDRSLSTEEAYAACGPAAAVAFARANGRNPSLREALDIAKGSGWTAAGGMNGVGNQKRLLDRMGIPSRLETDVNWKQVRQDATSGNPVTISTALHYFVADGYDPKTGRYHVGKSGTALRGGAEWLTPEQISALGKGVNGALYLNHPVSAEDSVAVAKT